METKNNKNFVRQVKRALALTLSAAMVVTGLNMSTFVPGAVEAIAASADEMTFTFDKLHENGGWGTTKEVDEAGKMSIHFSGQYAEIGFDLPEGVDSTKITKIVADVAEGDTSVFCLKVYKGSKEYTDITKYGSNVMDGLDGVDFDRFSFMTNSTAEGGVDFVISGATFTAEGIASLGAPSFAEDFDSYESADEKKGASFGSPKFSLVTVSENNQALAVTDRTDGYFAYAVNASAFAGNTISLSADVACYEAADDAENDFSATIKTTKAGEDDNYQNVAGVKLTGSAFGKLEGEYEVPADCDSYDIYFETTKEVNYLIDNISITIKGEYVAPSKPEYVDFSKYPILKDLYKDTFKMGMACEAISHWEQPNTLSEIGNPTKEAFIAQEFNSITFGNELKPAYNMDCNHAPDDVTVPFGKNAAAIEMLDWAKANNVPVRGHTLVWHSQCNDQIFCKDYKPVFIKDKDGKDTDVLDPACYVDAETLEKRMVSYIDDTMKYVYENGYGNVIYAWDVVNEAVEPGTNADNMRNSYWYQIMGKDFIAKAFKAAREASVKYAQENAAKYSVNPDNADELATILPKLFYNDYNEFQANKRDAIIAVTKPIKEAGNIDGIGMQAHLSDTSNLDDFITALNMYSEAIGEVHITELDVTQTSSGVNAEYYQGMFYYNLFKALIDAKKNGANLTCVTIWGLTDDNSWKKESSPLVLNGDLSKKLAFDGIVNAMTGDEMPEPAYEAPDFKDGIFDLDGADMTAADYGFAGRGDAKVEIQSEDTYTGIGALKVSSRTANWHGVTFDVSRFVGQTISISGWVKTTDSTVKLSADIDGSWPNIATINPESGKWTQLIGTYSIPSDLTALKLYFETNDTADIYVDNVEVKLVGLDEGFEGKENIASPRGVGHMPVLSVEKEGTNNVLKVTRQEKDATVKFDISKYIGRAIEVTAKVKTDDEFIMVGLDGDTPKEAAKVGSLRDGYTDVKAVFTIPSNLTSANMYMETSGKADMLIDDVKVRIADISEDLENGQIFTTRWGGAGTLELVEEENGNHVAKLTDKDQTYLGIVYDMTPYIGMQVEISFDVKTDDTVVKLSGDIDGLWPNYLTAATDPGKYKTVSCVANMPSDLTALKVYIETNGLSDIYIDNFKVKRVAAGKQFKVVLDSNGKDVTIGTQVVVDGKLAVDPGTIETEDAVITGWYKDAACTQKWTFTEDVVTEDITLYAAWGSKDGEDEPSASPAPSNDPSAKPSTSPSVKPSTSPSTKPSVAPSTTPVAPVVKVGDKEVVSGVTYVVTSATEAEYVAVADKGTVTIPDTVTIKGKKFKVTSIAKNAFKNKKKLKKVTIGKNIKKIGSKAFYGCKNLKKIVVKTTKLTKKKVGSKAFAKINAKAKFKVPAKKVKAYKAIVKAKGAKTAKVTK